MFKRKKFLIAGLLLVLALGYLAYMGFKGAGSYFLTVSELQSQNEDMRGKELKVLGKVEPDYSWDSKNLLLTFTITDQGASLPVKYSGVKPDTFDAGVEVVVDGKINTEGILEADTILTKCPSKYVPSK